MAVADILSSLINVAGKVQFDAAATPPNEVAVVPPGAAGVSFEDANGNLWIEPGDNLIIGRVWCSIPFGFGQGSGKHVIGLVFKDSLGNATIIPELAGNSVLTFPALCSSLEMPSGGLFISVPKNVGRVKLTLSNLFLNVSMINVPSALVGTTQKIQYHVSALHTKTLKGVP